MTHPFFTIGHSTRTADAFGALLQEAGVRRLVDVRTVPRSRANPQYDSRVLPVWLAEFQVTYEHAPALGGLRGRLADVPPATNAFWENQSFHNYADYALTPQFREGLAQLIATGRARTVAIMCAEAVWWRCHRRIIADYLLAAGETVLHILGRGHIVPARLTAGAEIGPDGSIVYPAADEESAPEA